MKNLLLPLILIISLQTQAYTPEYSTAGFYQTQAEVREAKNFNIGWRFIKSDVAGAEAIAFDDKDWQVVNLPDGLELLPLAASGGVNYQGPAWYRKHFEADTALKGKKVMLHFEGIMGKSKIWINGKLLRENFGSYYPIHLDVTDYLNYGENNLIAVRADNSNDPSYPPGKKQETLDFTYFGGIYRDVWFITHNEVYITHPLAVDKVAGGGVFVHYEELSEESVRVLIDADVANEGKTQNVQVKIELKDKDGELAASETTTIKLPKQGAQQASFDLKLNSPKLWQPDRPHLYDLYITISDASGITLDALKQKVGIRSIEMRGKEGLFLNGKRYPEKLMGANRHQDFAHIGHALSNNLHWRDALKLRQTGMRVIRSAHYIQDPAFMDACDALGLFIVTAIPGWQYWNDDPIFMERMLKDVRNLVRLERNRPSVLLWEMIPNETKFPDEYAIKSTTATKEEYPYPGCYTATDSHTKRVKSQKYFDVLYADDIVPEHPDKAVFKREWGDFVDNWVDHNSVSRVAKQWGEEAQMRQAMHYFKEEWVDNGKQEEWPSLTKAYKASPALVGATLWHPFDHQRGYHPDPFWGGIMDAYRQPKFSYYLMKSLLPTQGLEEVPGVEAEPFVYIAHLMTPFSPEDVVIFTNCEEVKLTMYGQEIGTKKTTDINSPVPRVPVIFEDAFRSVDARNKNQKGYGKIDLAYAPGALIKAKGLIDGKVVTEHQRWPVGRKRRLVLKIDDSGIPPVADGSDITTVVAYLVDAGGAVKRLSDEYVRFSVEGNGALIEDHENGINPQKMLWGEAVALVRSGIIAGEITVKAEVLKEGINMPDKAEISFTTTAPAHRFIYTELPSKKEVHIKTQTKIDESEELMKLREELLKTKKKLQDYELNEVGQQQQDFIQ